MGYKSSYNGYNSYNGQRRRSGGAKKFFLLFGLAIGLILFVSYMRRSRPEKLISQKHRIRPTKPNQAHKVAQFEKPDKKSVNDLREGPVGKDRDTKMGLESYKGEKIINRAQGVLTVNLEHNRHSGKEGLLKDDSMFVFNKDQHYTGPLEEKKEEGSKTNHAGEVGIDQFLKRRNDKKEYNQKGREGFVKEQGYANKKLQEQNMKHTEEKPKILAPFAQPLQRKPPVQSNNRQQPVPQIYNPPAPQVNQAPPQVNQAPLQLPINHQINKPVIQDRPRETGEYRPPPASNQNQYVYKQPDRVVNQEQGGEQPLRNMNYGQTANDQKPFHAQSANQGQTSDQRSPNFANNKQPPPPPIRLPLINQPPAVAENNQNPSPIDQQPHQLPPQQANIQQHQQPVYQQHANQEQHQQPVHQQHANQEQHQQPVYQQQAQQEQHEQPVYQQQAQHEQPVYQQQAQQEQHQQPVFQQAQQEQHQQPVFQQQVQQQQHQQPLYQQQTNQEQHQQPVYNANQEQHQQPVYQQHHVNQQQQPRQQAQPPIQQRQIPPLSNLESLGNQRSSLNQGNHGLPPQPINKQPPPPSNQQFEPEYRPPAPQGNQQLPPRADAGQIREERPLAAPFVQVPPPQAIDHGRPAQRVPGEREQDLAELNGQFAQNGQLAQSRQFGLNGHNLQSGQFRENSQFAPNGHVAQSGQFEQNRQFGEFAQERQFMPQNQKGYYREGGQNMIQAEPQKARLPVIGDPNNPGKELDHRYLYNQKVHNDRRFPHRGDGPIV